MTRPLALQPVIALALLFACEPTLVELALPAVASTSPAGGATGVGLEPLITITFDEAMRPDQGVVRLTSNLAVLPHTWDNDLSLSIALTESLRPNQTYELVASAFANLEGITIESHAWGFSTGRPPDCDEDREAPTVLSLTPALPWDSSVAELELVFSEPVIDVGPDTVAVSEPALLGGVSGSGDRYRIALAHLEMGGAYQLSLESGITDPCTNELDPIDLPFAVECETVPPQVVSGPFYGHDPTHGEGYLLRVSEPVSGLAAATLTAAPGAPNQGEARDLSLSITQVAADGYLVTPTASDWQTDEAFILALPVTIADVCGNTLPGAFDVRIDVVDCMQDITAPALTSSHIYTHDVAIPVPYALRLSENAEGVATGARMVGLAGNVGADLSMTIVGAGGEYSISWGASDWQHADKFVVTLDGITDACGNRSEALAISVLAVDACAEAEPHLDVTPVIVPVSAPNVVLSFDRPVAGLDVGSVTLVPVIGTGTIELIEPLTSDAVLVRLANIQPGDQVQVEVDAAAVSNPVCGVPMAGASTLTVDIFAQGTGLTCDSPYWLDSYVAGPQQALGSFNGFYDNADFYACSPATDTSVMSFAYHNLSATSVTAFMVDVTLITYQGGVTLLQTSNANVCPGSPVSSLGCDDNEPQFSLLYNVPGVPLGAPLFGLLYGRNSSFAVDPIFSFEAGPFGEDCNSARPLEVPGATIISFIEGGSRDLLSPSLAACEPGFAGIADSVFSVELTGTNNRVTIELQTGGDVVAVLLEDCSEGSRVRGCAVEPVFDPLILEARGLEPGRTYYVVIGDTSAGDWPPALPLTITVTEGEDLMLAFNGDGVAELTDATGTSTLELPLHSEYDNDENAAPGDLSYRRIHIPGATRLLLTGRYSVEDPSDVFEVWRGPNKAERVFTSDGLGDEGTFVVEVGSDTAEIGVASDWLISAVDSPFYDGYDLELLSYATD